MNENDDDDGDDDDENVYRQELDEGLARTQTSSIISVDDPLVRDSILLSISQATGAYPIVLTPLPTRASLIR